MTANEIKELAGNYTKAEYAELTWAQVKEFIAELDAEEKDDRSRFMQLVGFVGTAAKIYDECEW